MKHLRWASIAVLTLFPLHLVAQTEAISAKDAKRHLNQRVTVEGVVANVRTQGQETWISLEKAYPGTPLLIVMSADIAAGWGDTRSLANKRVRVTGTVRPSALEGAVPMTGREAMPEIGGGRPRAPSILLEDRSKLVVVGGQTD